MAPRWLHGLFVLILPVLASCSADRAALDNQPVRYDVREAMVIAGGDVPKDLIRGVDRRVADSIQATVRTEPLPRVVLTIEIQKVEKGIGQKQDRNSAIVAARATAVENGEQIAMTTFRVFNYGSLEMSDHGLAEEIAARVRSAFALTRPGIPKQSPQSVQPAAPLPAEPDVAGTDVVFPDVPATAMPALVRESAAQDGCAAGEGHPCPKPSL